MIRLVIIASILASATGTTLCGTTHRRIGEAKNPRLDQRSLPCIDTLVGPALGILFVGDAGDVTRS